MRVESAPLTYPPYACLVTGREDGELCDFEVDVPPYADGDIPRLYIKREIVEEAARELGMAPASEVEALRAQVEEYGGKVTEALDTLAVAAEFEDRIATATQEQV